MRRLTKLGVRVARKSARVVGAFLERKQEVGPPQTLRSPQPSPAHSGVPRLGDPVRPAQVYGSESCPWTGRARALLEDQGAEYDFIDLDAAENRQVRDWLVVETRQNKNPYIYLRGRFIGGFNALDQITRLGQLQDALLSAKERATKSPRVIVEVLTRDVENETPAGEK